MGAPVHDKVTEGVPLARIIPRRLASDDIVTSRKPESVLAEQFRRLSAFLRSEFPGGAAVAVTSATPAEGKTVVAANLSLTLARDDTPALLIDGNLRRPALGRWLYPEPRLGLSDFLLRGVPLEHVVLDLTNSPLQVIPAGSPVLDPVRSLSGDRFRSLLSTLRSRHRWIVVDTPPVLPFQDADAIGAASDGMLLVVRAGVTTRRMYLDAIDSITSAPVVGAVRNVFARSLSDRFRYTDRYYRDYAVRRRRPSHAVASPGALRTDRDH